MLSSCSSFIPVKNIPQKVEGNDFLINLIDSPGHVDVAQQGARTVKGARTDDALTTAETDLKVRYRYPVWEQRNADLSKTLLERFANYTSADDVVDAINQMYRDADRDPELKGWFRQLDGYIRKCLKQQGFVFVKQGCCSFCAVLAFFENHRFAGRIRAIVYCTYGELNGYYAHAYQPRLRNWFLVRIDKGLSWLSLSKV